MADVEVNCQVSCQVCHWDPGSTIRASEERVAVEVLTFARACIGQHPGHGAGGKLLVTWEPLR